MLKFREKISILSVVVMVSSPAFAQTNRFNELRGRWVSLQENKEIRIEDDGTVFSQSPKFPLSGSVGRCINGGANFCFAGQSPDGHNFLCAYHVSFLNGDQSVNFGVTQESFVGCPNGLFSRTH